MKAALLIVLSLSALAMAGPAFNKNTNNHIADMNQQMNKENYMTQKQQQLTGGDFKKTEAVEILQKWCFASQMSQSELTSSFKRLVGIVKASPAEQSTEAAVMSGRICQGALVQKSDKSGETVGQTESDAQAHELIKDVYMDSLMACETRECMQQLLEIIESEQVDPIRASYYMTRVAVGSDISTKSTGIKDETEVKQLALNFIQKSGKPMYSEAVERQQLLAVTATLGKSLEEDETKQQKGEIVEIAEQVAKVIVERYIKPVSQQDVREYQQQQQQTGKQQNIQLTKKIAKRSAALKALANLPSWCLKEVEQQIVEIAQNKDESSTVRQSAIECLEENEKQTKALKEITFDQDEPTEVRVAAYRALMSAVEEESEQQQVISQLVKHCEQTGNQQQDEQFVLYVISHLENLRSSEQPELASIKETIEENKQQQMQIQILAQKFKQQLEQVGKSSRNYKLEQQFNQLDTGLTLEGDIIYESESKKESPMEILPKVVRLNVSMPVMGESVNVFEVTLRQSGMDEQLSQVLNLVQSGKVQGPEAMNKLVDGFKQAAEKQIVKQQTGSNKQQEQVEADLSVNIDDQTVIYLSLEDIMYTLEQHNHHQQKNRSTRSIGQGEFSSLFESVLEHLKRQPVAFNRGINFNLNERIAKVLDVEACLIAGLRFESRAQGRSSEDFEILVRAEPRFAFESIVGPAKVSAKKLLNRISSKSSLGLRLRYKEGELVDLEIELPMEKYELFSIEQQLVEQKRDSFVYLDESVFGQADIYAQDDIFEDIYSTVSGNGIGIGTGNYKQQGFKAIRKMKRSVFGGEPHSSVKSLAKLVSGKQTIFGVTFETPDVLSQATGMSGKLRLVVSPKELGFIMQCVAQKVDQRMSSIRIQLQKEESRSSGQQKQYQLTLSTPGSRVERTTQIRLVQQVGQQRHLVKAVVESPMMSGQAGVEFVHDGRQYAFKCELQAERQKHTFEMGVQRGQQSASGRIAATYKPYLQIDSSKLKRPIQMQAIVSVQQEPKTVIAYELKSMSSSANYVQGKIIVDAKSAMGAQFSKRRSMESPVERLLSQDLTLVSELVIQLQESHVAKVHQMVQWEPSKLSCQADMTVQHKDLRKNQEKQMSGLVKVDSEKQMIQWECKSQQQPRGNYRVQLVSETKPGQHQLVAEVRYKENLGEIVAYKHRISVASGKPTQWNKFDLVTEVELVASEWSVAEKLSGRTHVIWERQQKQVECELSSNGKQAKLSMDYAGPEQHKLELMVKADRVGQHVTQIRATPSVVSLVSRTDCFKRQQLVQKTELEIIKPTGVAANKRQLVLPEVRLRLEMPTRQTVVAVDAKLASGKPSSWQLECPVFVSRGEFTFATVARAAHFIPSVFRFRTENRDLVNKNAYWLDSHVEPSKRSFVRAFSPLYGGELEIEPDFEQSKVGFFARDKPSVNQFEEIFSPKLGLFARQTGSGVSEKLELANKLWAARSVLKRVPAAQKKRILNLILEFVDRDQSHHHSLEYDPIKQSTKFELGAQSQQQRWSPMRVSGRFEADPRCVSQLEMDSQWGDFELTGKPFDGETSFAKLSAISRHPRAAFNKHESEIRYEREHGFRGQLKHQDANNKSHQMWLETAKRPTNWAKLQVDSQEHGKAKWEHKWRHEQKKRHSKRSIMDEQDFEKIYENQLSAEFESPRSQLSQRTQINWQEPVQKSSPGMFVNRNAGSDKYSLVDYLKRVNGRVQSQWHKQQQPIYDLDFDFKPDSDKSQQAALKMRLNKEWVHDTQFNYQPSERLYKLSSRTLSDRTREPIYELSAQTGFGRVSGLATEQQEPMFFNDQQEMVSGPLAQSALASLFKQPLKLDYTDKFGRSAGIHYDHSPVANTLEKQYAGLRQKRAALYYRDPSQEIEHQTEIDFYPELMVAGSQKHFGHQHQQEQFAANKLHNMFHLNEKPGQMTFKTHTKYGPVLAQVDSDQSACQLKLVSPIMTGKLTAETAGGNKHTGRVTSGGAKLFKLELTNKQQQVSAEKMLRKLPIVGQLELFKEVAKNLDQSRFEHQSELLVSSVESIVRLKSETRDQNRPLVRVDAELNMNQEKLIVKVDGKHSESQLLVDLVTKSAQFNLSTEDKRQLQHQTRIVKLNDKFYQVESMTTYKQKPIFKFNGKIAAILIENPELMFQQTPSTFTGPEHISTFEATIFEPKPYEIKCEFNTVANTAMFKIHNIYEKKVQMTVLKWDPKTETLFTTGKLEEQNNAKPVYTFTSKINFPGLYEPYQCSGQACQSEFIYKNEQAQEQYSGKIVPAKYISFATPKRHQTINWVF